MSGYGPEFVAQETELLVKEYTNRIEKYGQEYADHFIEGAKLCLDILLPLIMKDGYRDEEAAPMADGAAMIAGHAAWLLNLRRKDWSNAER